MFSVSLKEILEKEVFLFQDLLVLEEKTYCLLIEGEYKALQDLTLQKEELLREVDRLEQERQRLNPQGITLREFMEKNSLEAEKLQVLRKSLLQVYHSLRRIKKANYYLVNHNLNFIKYVFDLLFPGKEEIIYASSGEMKQKELFYPLLFDHNA